MERVLGIADISCGPPTRSPERLVPRLPGPGHRRARAVASGGRPTVFAAFESGTDYFGSRAQQTMLNFRVRDLDAMLAQLRDKGADVAEETQDMDGVGRFGWVTDPEALASNCGSPPDRPYGRRAAFSRRASVPQAVTSDRSPPHSVWNAPSRPPAICVRPEEVPPALRERRRQPLGAQRVVVGEGGREARVGTPWRVAATRPRASRPAPSRSPERTSRRTAGSGGPRGCRTRRGYGRGRPRG